MVALVDINPFMVLRAQSRLYELVKIHIQIRCFERIPMNFWTEFQFLNFQLNKIQMMLNFTQLHIFQYTKNGQHDCCIN